jgi:aspartyl/asparaginyl-tRNA synthetase
MIIFVDRINPSNLLLRLHQSGIETAALQIIAVNEIKTEFQHNITQQLYLEPTTWKVLQQLKDDTITMINNAVKNLPTDASGLELSKRVLNHMSEIEENPYELTIGLIKQDIHRLF